MRLGLACKCATKSSVFNVLLSVINIIGNKYFEDQWFFSSAFFRNELPLNSFSSFFFLDEKENPKEKANIRFWMRRIKKAWS